MEYLSDPLVRAFAAGFISGMGLIVIAQLVVKKLTFNTLE